MKIELSLNPNCSEAVCRIKVNRMPRNKKAELYRKLEEAVNKYSEEGGETSISMGRMFGIEMITIDGDMPFNDPNTIEEIITLYRSMVKVECSDN